jgi:hypothetical protein
MSSVYCAATTRIVCGPLSVAQPAKAVTAIKPAAAAAMPRFSALLDICFLSVLINPDLAIQVEWLRVRST